MPHRQVSLLKLRLFGTYVIWCLSLSFLFCLYRWRGLKLNRFNLGSAWMDEWIRFFQHKNMVVVKSPRSRETLDRLLGHTNCVLAAEHGAFIRWGKHARWQVGLCCLCPVCAPMRRCTAGAHTEEHLVVRKSRLEKFKT